MATEPYTCLQVANLPDTPVGDFLTCTVVYCTKAQHKIMVWKYIV